MWMDDGESERSGSKIIMTWAFRHGADDGRCSILSPMYRMATARRSVTGWPGIIFANKIA